MLKTSPAVFAVGNNYQIMVEVTKESLFSVKIGEDEYFDESNGIMNSLADIHRVSVPMEKLDNAKEYIVCVRPLIERKPYFTETDEVIKYTYRFNPVPNENVRIYHLSDTHNRIEEPIEAVKTFGDIDLLILNGDIIDHSGSPDKFANIYEICSRLTGGNVPVVFSRGNHDMRGNYAEKFADFTPNQNHNTYYTFTVGGIWGMILDCGEDKLDKSKEYGFTVACHAFRQRQTDYIKEAIKNAKNEYEKEEINTRLVISHVPFTYKFSPPFNIEEDTYGEWAKLLKEHVKPHLMICGHTHEYGIDYVGGKNDYQGQPCNLVVASEPQGDRFIGCGFIIDKESIKVIFTDSLGNIVEETVLEK